MRMGMRHWYEPGRGSYNSMGEDNLSVEVKLVNGSNHVVFCLLGYQYLSEITDYGKKNNRKEYGEFHPLPAPQFAAIQIEQAMKQGGSSDKS